MEQNSTNLGDEKAKDDNSGANPNQNNTPNFNNPYYNANFNKPNFIKPKSVFWGTLFFVVGFLVLLSNLHIELAVYNPKIIDFWPLLLIMYGVSFFKLPLVVKQINASLGAILIVVLLMNLFTSGYNWVNVVKKSKFIKINHNSDDDFNGKMSEYQDVKKILIDTNYKKSHFIMNAGAGDFKLFSINNEYLIEVKSNTEMNYGKLYTSLDTIRRTYDVVYKTNTGKDEIDIDSEEFDRQVDFILNENTLWTIESNIGAGKFEYDLTNVNFDSLEINAGAAEINVKFGEKIEKSYLNINSGATEVNIKLPKNIGCQIITKTALTENNFNEFIRVKDDLYETVNFKKSSKRLYIKIDGGISSYNVETY